MRGLIQLKTLAIQAVLFNQPAEELERFCTCLTALQAPEDWRLELRTGDCGEPTRFPEGFAQQLQNAEIAWNHVEFGENLGFGKGHNRLFRSAPSERVWLINPDALFSRDLLIRLVEFADSRTGFGIVEPRLSPLEHPKAVDYDTYETGWCSGCAPLIDSQLFDKVGGFDEGLFLYGEDVDLSWRIKAAGGKLFCCPWASVYHSRVGETSSTEKLWSQVSELLLLKKYGRKGHLLCRLADLYSTSPDWLRTVLGSCLAHLPSLGKATQGEVDAASWTGRLNTPFRWQPLPVTDEPGSEEPAVHVREGVEDDAVETALGAWAAGASSISTELLIGRLPFPVQTIQGALSLEPGHVPFPNGFPPKAYLTYATIKCGKGWLGASFQMPDGPANSVRRVETTVRPELFYDPEGYRFVLRKIRARVRLRNLPSDLSEQVHKMLG